LWIARTLNRCPIQVAVSAALVFFIAVWLLRSVFSWLLAKPKATIAQRSTRAIQSLPIIKGIVAKQRQASVDSAQAQIAEKDPNVEALHSLPPAGLDVDSVMMELEERAVNDFRYADGESKASGAIYMSGDSHRDLLNDAYCMFSQANPMHTDLFPSVRRMEAEVVSMTANLLGGGRSGVPTVRPSSMPFGSLTGPASMLLGPPTDPASMPFGPLAP
jgi:hypothetical protein